MAAKKGAKKGVTKTAKAKPKGPSEVEQALALMIEDFCGNFVVLNENNTDIYNIHHLFRPETSGPMKGRVKEIFIGQAMNDGDLKVQISKFVKDYGTDFLKTKTPTPGDPLPYSHRTR